MCIRDSHTLDSILENLTRWYDLEPGDLVWTGTPKGVGPMNVGDLVEAWMKDSEGNIVSHLRAFCE